MPFLRFARDKRGYETTSLVHAGPGRQGRSRQRILYWFRSPPNVKVGRPALDQEAIRWIEEHNPDIEFDWPQILQATAPPAAPPEDARGRRPRRSRTDRPARTDQPARTERPERRPPQGAPAAAAPPPSETGSDPGFSAISPDAPTPFEEEAIEQIIHPDSEETPKVALPAVEAVLGREQLIRFRARYAELQARIIERGGEPSRVEELRAQAEPLDPDSWVTMEEARTGLEQFEPKVRELRTALGLKRRRRSRRGGRRRRGPQSAAESAGAQTAAADSSSNSPVEDPHEEADAPEENDAGNNDTGQG